MNPDTRPRPPAPHAPARRRRMSSTTWAMLFLCLGGAAVVMVFLAFVTMARAKFPAEASPAAAAVPAYEVVKQRRHGADLLVREATVGQARAAITDWIGRNKAGRDYLSVMVVRSADAKTYVCAGEYAADEQTSKVRTGGRVAPGATLMNCPDPK